jgi:1-acyl-sn-glycerol-3-phosphate acyltransferase
MAMIYCASLRRYDRRFPADDGLILFPFGRRGSREEKENENVPKTTGVLRIMVADLATE